MNVLVAEKSIMSNVSAKLYDEERTVDSLYIEPELKSFASSFGKKSDLSLTYVLSRIIEFCVQNESKILVDRNMLEDKISKKGSKTTVRVKKDIYTSFTKYIDQIETSRSAYLNMVLRKMYEEQEVSSEFSTNFLEKILFA
ncbi:hypothetical protein R4575_16945 [Acinetobacter baumannii]|nr:hypothetical protein [Acinetobacter baumannii]